MKTLLFTLVLVLISSWVHAGCWYQGKEYKTGEVVENYVCGSDGYWKQI
ncbi:MAG: hypothetical protein ACI8ZB_004179 [Desulforhopalus sp.]|jgi:hypothetical protein